MKTFNTVLVESVAVGIFLIVFYYIVNSISKPVENLVTIPVYIKLFISGILFHLAFEYAGLNKMYSKHYMESLAGVN